MEFRINHNKIYFILKVLNNAGELPTYVSLRSPFYWPIKLKAIAKMHFLQLHTDTNVMSCKSLLGWLEIRQKMRYHNNTVVRTTSAFTASFYTYAVVPYDAI